MKKSRWWALAIVLGLAACSSGASPAHDGAAGSDASGAAGSDASGAVGGDAGGAAGSGGGGSTGSDAGGTTGEAGTSGADAAPDAFEADARDADATGGAGSMGDAAAVADAGADLADAEVGPQPATFQVSLDDAAPKIELRATQTLQVSVAANGYVGPVALHVEGLPAEVTAKLASATVTLKGTGTETTSLELAATSTAIAGDDPFKVVGSVAAGTVTASAKLTVQPTITFTIPPGVNDGVTATVTDRFGAYPTVVEATSDLSVVPIRVRFFNADAVPHIIHAGNPDEGFPHGNTGIGIVPGTFDADRLLRVSGTYDFSLHDSGHLVRGRLVVEPRPL